MDTPRIAPDDEPEPPSEWGALVAQALELYATRGLDAFERLCADHPDAAPRLRERLASLERLGWIEVAGASSANSPARIGRYRIVREIGRGGMGVVFLAIDERLDRRVAIKTLSSRVPVDARHRERFVREVRAVAQLRHPGIIPLFEFDDASEIPFFTMEFVEGATLAEALARLNASGRSAAELTALDLWLALFPDSPSAPPDWGRSYSESVARLTMEVAAALEHAHQHGIVHRDVKPSNVLVGRDGHARLFDFGLAQRGIEDALTRTGEFVGTFLYVAPEQIAGAGELDARADVYSLGATLYELATLKVPFQATTTQQLLREIATRDPKPARAWNPQLPADLETVAATALEKNPRQRYASAAALADDLRRVLELRPIVARASGRWTRTLRFARRNPAATAALLLAATLVVVLPTVLFVANRSLRRERDNSEAVLEFFLKAFELGDAEERGPDVRAREILEDGALRLARKPELIPRDEPRARVLRTLGSLFWMMGSYDLADEQLTRALAIQRRALGTRDREVGLTLNFLGNLRRDQGRSSEAMPLYREALAIFEASEGERGENTAMVLGNLSTLLSLMGDNEQAQALGRRAVEIVESNARRGADDSTQRVDAYTALAHVLARAGALDEAETNYQRVLELLGAAPAPSKRAGVFYGLGRLEIDRGRLGKSEEYLTLALDDYLTGLGPESSSTLITLRVLGEVQLHEGAVEEAQATLSCAWAGLVRACGPRHTETALAEFALGNAFAESDGDHALELYLDSATTLEALGDDAPPNDVALAWLAAGDLLVDENRCIEAVPVLERALARYRGRGIPAVSRFSDALMSLGIARVRLGEVAVGEACLLESRDVLAATPGDYPRAWIAADSALGECRARAGRFEESQALLLDVIERTRDRADASHLHAGAVERLVDLYRRWKKPELAESWRAKLAPRAR